MKAGLGLIAFVALVAQGQRAEAFCLEGPLTTTGGVVLRTVPVYLYATSTQTTFLGSPIGEVEAAIRAVTNTWWEEGNAHVRTYYAGRTTSTSTTGRVVIREDWSAGCTRCGSSSACEVTSPSGSQRYGSTIWFEAPASCTFGGQPWSTIPLQETDGFRWALLHEMGHSLGLQHPDQSPSECTWGGSSDPALQGAVMGRYHDLYVLLDDRQGLVNMYGPRCRDLDRFTANSTFTAWTRDTSYDVCTQARPQGAGLWFTNKIVLAFKQDFLVAALTDNFGSTTLDYPETLAASVHPPALARGPDENDLIAIWGDAYDAEQGVDPCEYAKIAVSHDGGDTWTVVPNALNPCISGAPSVAYDVKTGYYVAFFNGPAAQYYTYDLNGNFVNYGNTIGEKLYAVHTPVVACAPLLDSNRCQIIYDRNDPFGYLSTRTVDVLTTGKVAYGSETVKNFSLENTPALMYRNGEGTYPWAMAFKSNDSLFSMIKPYTGGGWTTTRLIVTDTINGVTSAALGLRLAGGVYVASAYAGRFP